MPRGQGRNHAPKHARVWRTPKTTSSQQAGAPQGSPAGAATTPRPGAGAHPAARACALSSQRRGRGPRRSLRCSTSPSSEGGFLAHHSPTGFVSLKRIKTGAASFEPLGSAHARDEGTAPSGARLGPYREEAGVEVEEGHEHQHQQDPAPQLHVLLGGALAHGGHAREHALPLRTGLRQEQQQAPSQGQVPEGQKRQADRQGSAGSTAPPDRTRATEPARGHGTADKFHLRKLPTTEDTDVGPPDTPGTQPWPHCGPAGALWASVFPLRPPRPPVKFGVGRDARIHVCVLRLRGGSQRLCCPPPESQEQSGPQAVSPANSYSAKSGRKGGDRPPPDARTSSKTSSPRECCRQSSVGTRTEKLESQHFQASFYFYRINSIRQFYKYKLHKTQAGSKASRQAQPLSGCWWPRGLVRRSCARVCRRAARC